jgi:hypothetical protein
MLPVLCIRDYLFPTLNQLIKKFKTQFRNRVRIRSDLLKHIYEIDKFKNVLHKVSVLSHWWKLGEVRSDMGPTEKGLKEIIPHVWLGSGLDAAKVPDPGESRSGSATLSYANVKYTLHSHNDIICY